MHRSLEPPPTDPPFFILFLLFSIFDVVVVVSSLWDDDDDDDDVEKGVAVLRVYPFVYQFLTDIYLYTNYSSTLNPTP